MLCRPPRLYNVAAARGADGAVSPSASRSVEINANGARLNDKYDSGHLTLLAGTLDAVRVFNRGGRFAPYFSIGAGAVQAQPQVLADQTNLAVEAGIGAR